MGTTATLKIVKEPLRDGTWPIKLIICKDRKTRKIGTDFHTHPDHWDQNRGQFTTHPDKKKANADLIALLSRAQTALEDIDKRYPTAPVAKVKELLAKAMAGTLDYEHIAAQDFFSHMDRFIKNIVIKATKKHFETSRSILGEYFKKIPFEELNREKLDAFKAWAFTTPISNEKFRTKSTVRGYLRDMRRVWNWVEENEKNNPENKRFLKEAYPFREQALPAIKRKERKKKITFAGRVMDFLIGYDATWNQSDEFAFNRQLALDTFLLQYGLLGMRIHDALTLKKTEISQDGHSLKYDMNKTGEVKHFKLPDFVVKIIGHYKHLPGAFVLPHFENEWEMPSVEQIAVKRDTVNRNLAVICKKIGLPKITTHGARRCAGRKMIENQINVLDIQAMYGHEEFSTTLDYIASFELYDIIDTNENGSPIFGVLHEESKINSMVDVMNKKAS